MSPEARVAAADRLRRQASRAGKASWKKFRNLPLTDQLAHMAKRYANFPHTGATVRALDTLAEELAAEDAAELAETMKRITGVEWPKARVSCAPGERFPAHSCPYCKRPMDAP
jgi:hypothetical protein